MQKTSSFQRFSRVFAVQFSDAEPKHGADGKQMPDITFTGFDLAEAQELFGSGSFENVHEDEFDAESAAAEIAEPKTRHGDLWLIGKHRLLCGDCTLDNDVAKLMDGREADVMVTDPPYNVDYGSAIIGKNKSKTRAESSIANDNMSDDDFHDLF